jgi:hypothetical protein
LNQLQSSLCISVGLVSLLCLQYADRTWGTRGRCASCGWGWNGLPLKDNESSRVRMSNDEIICSNGGRLAFVLVSPHKRNASCSRHLHFTKSHIRDSHFD